MNSFTGTLLAIGISVFLLGCGSQEPAKVARIGEVAPDFSYTLIESGEKQLLSDTRGKIVLAEFWATWCVPCQNTMKALQSYANTYPHWKNQVTVLAINIDDNLELAKRQIKRSKWTYGQYGWLNPDKGRNAMVKAYAGKGIPAAYVIGVDGVIIDAGSPEKAYLTESINRLLEESKDGL